jgi:zinc protease
MKRILTLVCLFLASSAQADQPTSSYLKNGLQVVVLPNHRAPVVSISVWYKAGSADEDPLKSGAAHFLEHMMFQGTKTVGPGDFKRRLASLGGYTNAFTTYDYTYFLNIVAKANLKEILKLEADRMANLQIDPKKFALEKSVVLRERVDITEDSPDGAVAESVNSRFFINHPYRIPVIGWRHEIESLGPQDIKDFYKKWYAPNNAVVIFAGDVTPEEAISLTKEAFGSIKPRKVPARNRLKDPLSDFGTQKLSFAHPEFGASFAKIYRMDIVPQTLKYRYTFLLLSMIIKERLHTLLINVQDLASFVDVHFSVSHLDPFNFEIHGGAKAANQLTTIEALIDGALKDLSKNGVTPEELSYIKELFINNAYWTLSDLTDVSSGIGNDVVMGYSLEEILKWKEMIQNLSVADLNEAAEKVFNRPSHLTVLKQYGEKPL